VQDRQVVGDGEAARERLRLAHLEAALRHDVAALRRSATSLKAPQIERTLAALEERLDDCTLSVLVLGEFNRGKSALINTMLGDAWLPTGVAPTTRVVTEVRFGAEARIEVHYRDGVCQQVDRQTLAALASGNAATGAAGDDASLPTRAVLHLPVPVLRHLTFIDTPGLNDPDNVPPEVIYDLLPRCDVALFVLAASFALSHSERTIIGDKLLRASLGRLVFVLGRADELDGPDDEAAVLQRVSALLEPVLGRPPLVLPYSARDALGGRNAALRRLLTEQLPAEKGALLLTSARGQAAAAAETLSELLRFRRAHLEGTLADLDDELARLGERESLRRARVAAALEVLAQRLAAVRDEYLATLRGLANSLSASLPAEVRAVAPDDVRRYLPFYIQDTFRWHLEETLPHLRDAVEGACVAAAGELQDLLPRQPADLPSSVAADAFPLGGRLAPDAWDQGLVASVFIGAVGLLLNPLLAAALLVGGPTLRLLSLKARRTAERAALLAEADRAVVATADVLSARVADALTAFEARLREQAEAALAVEVETVRATLEDLRARRAAGAEMRDVQEQQIAADLAVLEALRRRLGAVTDVNGHATDAAPSRPATAAEPGP
jgi:Dynamin family